MLKYAPTNEQEIVYLFARISDKLNLTIKRIQTEFPDCLAIDQNGKEIKIEFEFYTINFNLHKHDISKCDMVIAWADDINLKEKIKVIELCKYFPNLHPDPVETAYNPPPNRTIEGLRIIAKGEANKDNLTKLFKTYHQKERQKEPIRFIARLITNGGDPYVKDRKIYLHKPIDLQTIKYSVSKDKKVLDEAKKILKQVGFDFD